METLTWLLALVLTGQSCAFLVRAYYQEKMGKRKMDNNPMAYLNIFSLFAVVIIVVSMN